MQSPQNTSAEQYLNYLSYTKLYNPLLPIMDKKLPPLAKDICFKLEIKI